LKQRIEEFRDWFRAFVKAFGAFHNNIGADGIMQIYFESSGGYANIRTTYHGNTDELPEEVSNELIKLVESSRVLDLQDSEVAPSSSGPPDVMYYKLTVQEGNKRASLYFNDVTAPDSLRPLLTRLQELAWEQARRGK
jgi:hypothetical protein